MPTDDTSPVFWRHLKHSVLCIHKQFAILRLDSHHPILWPDYERPRIATEAPRSTDYSLLTEVWNLLRCRVCSYLGTSLCCREERPDKLRTHSLDRHLGGGRYL